MFQLDELGRGQGPLLNYFTMGLLAKFFVFNARRNGNDEGIGMLDFALLPILIQLTLLPSLVDYVRTRTRVGSKNEPLSQLFLGYGLECVFMEGWELIWACSTFYICAARHFVRCWGQWYFDAISNFVDEYLSDPYQCVERQLSWLLPLFILGVSFTILTQYVAWNSGERGNDPILGTVGGGQGNTDDQQVNQNEGQERKDLPGTHVRVEENNNWTSAAGGSGPPEPVRLDLTIDEMEWTYRPVTTTDAPIAPKTVSPESSYQLDQPNPEVRTYLKTTAIRRLSQGQGQAQSMIAPSVPTLLPVPWMADLDDRFVDSCPRRRFGMPSSPGESTVNCGNQQGQGDFGPPTSLLYPSPEQGVDNQVGFYRKIRQVPVETGVCRFKHPKKTLLNRYLVEESERESSDDHDPQSPAAANSNEPERFHETEPVDHDIPEEPELITMEDSEEIEPDLGPLPKVSKLCSRCGPSRPSGDCVCPPTRLSSEVLDSSKVPAQATPPKRKSPRKRYV